MDRQVTPPKRVTSPTWGPPSPCKQALSRASRCELHSSTDRKIIISVLFNVVNFITENPVAFAKSNFSCVASN